MVANLGLGSLFIAFLVGLYGIGASIYGLLKEKAKWIDSAKNAMLLTFPLLSLTVLSLVYLLVTDHFELSYVANVTSQSMPVYLKITSLWGAQAGSLVFWSWLMAAFASAVTLRKWNRDREFLPWVIVVLLVTLVFFLGLSLFVENPFRRLWLLPSGNVITALFSPEGAKLFFPRDGHGMNPLLRHPGMIIHPPMLYLGFVSFVIPYAFAIASLITGRTDDRWIKITRRWTLWAWLFLSLGLVLGMRWAYDVLGWGGYWGWDPVEISALLPWLTGTAFLHSVMTQEKRRMFKHWNMVLIILTYDLVIFGTFLTRSGILSSVHAFAQSQIGPLFFGFIGLTFVVSVSLLLRRWNELKARTHLQSIFSRESLFLFNNLLFMGIFIVSFWGVVFPLLSELVTGQKVTVGPTFYERNTALLFAALLFLMAIAPLSAWRFSTGKTLWRSVWRPLVVSLIVPLIIPPVGGIHHWVAVLGFWLVAFVAIVTLREFWRGAHMRMTRKGESFPKALGSLISRNRRRYGGYIIHLGMIFMALGILGIEIFQTQTQGTIPQGEQMTLGDYSIIYRKLDVYDETDGKNVARATVSLFKNGEYLQDLFPTREFYYDSKTPVTLPSIRSTLVDDVYVILVDWLPISSQGATFKLFRNPLVLWLWIGSWVFFFGLLLAVWPSKE